MSFFKYIFLVLFSSFFDRRTLVINKGIFFVQEFVIVGIVILEDKIIVIIICIC